MKTLYMKKIAFSAFLCAFCLMFSFLFVGCGDNHTFKQVVKEYNEIATDYNGVFYDSNGNLKIKYSSEISSSILVSDSSSLYYNLKNDETNGAAIFETVLKADVTAVNYFINWKLDDYKKVPTERVNSLYSTLKDMKGKLYNLSRVKTSLEAASNKDNWLKEYRKNLHETIKSYNSFATQFLTVFEKYVQKDTTPEGRISVSKTQLEFAKKLVETCCLMEESIIKDYVETPFVGDDNISTNFLSTYTKAKNVFSDEYFQTVVNRSKTEKEASLIKALENIENYNSYYYSEKNKIDKILSKESAKELSRKETENTLTDDERMSLNKIRDFYHTFAVMKSYMKNYADALSDFE